MFNCRHCTKTFRTERGFNQHTQRSHGYLKDRQDDPSPENKTKQLLLTIIHLLLREIQ